MSSFIRPITTPSRAIAVAALLSTTLLAGSLTIPSAAAAPLQLAQASAPQTPPTPAVSPTKHAVPEIPAASTTQATPQTQPTQQTQQTPQGDTTAQTKAETVDQRITSLHEELQITPKQEPKWDHVAQVMRDNAAAMQKLVDERDQADNITAVQNLKEYEKFAQAHVTNLRKLSAAFDTLYSSMPAAQQKVADQVFANFGHHHNGAAAHS